MENFFTSILPAPNPTGKLHMGHMLNLTIQDILCRWYALHNYKVLWPATLDHGGISTQFVVERRLRDSGIDPASLQKAEIEGHINDWKSEISPWILAQMSNLGIAMDFSEIGTIDGDFYGQEIENLFKELYRKELVYQDTTILNWCPCCRTSLSDMEIVIQEETNRFYVINYEFVDQPGTFLPVTAKNLSTFHGDVAIALNPNDCRYAHLAGQQSVICPITGKLLPIVLETFVDQNFCSGVTRITPGAVAQDFLIARNRGLEIIEVYNAVGAVLLPAGPVFAANLQIENTELLRSKGRIVSQYDLLKGNSYCKYCSNRNISRISEEWFLRIEQLVAGGKQLLEKHEVAIYPRKYEAVSIAWMNNIMIAATSPQKWWEGHCMAVQKSLAANTDWCISRELNNGNRIPVHTCTSCGHKQLDDDGVCCLHCGSEELSAEFRVMDMWLSCALWCFVQNKRFPAACHTTKSVTVTGYDLLYLWISTTIMLSAVLDDGLPFKEVIIHPVIGDSQGRKMSKSLGNTLVADDLIADFGSDALRLSLLIGMDIEVEVVKFSENNLQLATTLLMEAEIQLQRMYGALPKYADISSAIVSKSPVYTKLAERMICYDFSAMFEILQQHVQIELPLLVDQVLLVEDKSELNSLFHVTRHLLGIFAPQLVASMYLA